METGAATLRPSSRNFLFLQVTGYPSEVRRSVCPELSTPCFTLALPSVFVYMLLAALYEDLLRPLAVMFSIPLAFIGAFVGLVVSGNTINLFSMLGMILLMALVAKNGILLMDYTDTLRKRGLARSEAIVEASVTRLRPILMTSFTIVFAMIPLSPKLTSGAEARSPVSVVLMGGVLILLCHMGIKGHLEPEGLPR